MGRRPAPKRISRYEAKRRKKAFGKLTEQATTVSKRVKRMQAQSQALTRFRANKATTPLYKKKATKALKRTRKTVTRRKY